MDSFFDEVEQTAKTQLKKARWALGINGALSVALGVIILVWPTVSLFALTVVFGAFVTAQGVVGLAAAIRGTVKEERGWLAFGSVLNIVVGVLLLVWSGSGISELALLYVIGIYAIGLGIVAIVGGFWLPLKGGDTALLVLTGLVSIMFGIVMFARPGAGALVALALISAFALVTGISQLVVAIGGERLLEARTKKHLHQPKPHPQAS